MSKIKKISEEEALAYCNRQEDDFFDLKSSRINGAKIQEIAVAFANSDGGLIIIGIEDEKTSAVPLDRWKGKEKIEDYNGIIQSIVELNPSIDFKHEFLWKEGEYIRSYVLKIEISTSLKVHETLKGEVYIRRGAQSLKQSGLKIQDLLRAKGQISEEDSYLNEIEPEVIVDSSQLSNYLMMLPITDKDPLSFALQERLLNKNSFSPTVAAIILFAENPSSLMKAQCSVKIVRYDSSDDEIDRDKLTIDLHTIDGNLVNLIKLSFDRIKEVLSRNHTWTMNGIAQTSYPDEAIWETLVNSVLHRDYAISDNVLVSIYRNRVVFRSPGRLPGYVTPENILTNRFSRNPKLVRLLSQYPDSFNKDLGEGINTVFDRMKQKGFIDPVISDKDNCVTVSLYRTPTRDQGEIILDFIDKHGSINNRQALDILGLEKAEQVTTIFSKLKDKGDIKRADEKQTGIRVNWIFASKKQAHQEA